MFGRWFDGLKEGFSDFLGRGSEVTKRDIAGLKKAQDAVGITELTLGPAEADTIKATENPKTIAPKRLRKLDMVVSG